MSDEFGDVTDVVVTARSAAQVADEHVHASPATARLIARLYRGADAPMRQRMLACLLRPLGPLGLVAVAAGAFASLLHRGGEDGLRVALQEVGTFSKDQIIELARFVEQVNPEALQQVASMISDSPLGIAAFSVSAALLLARALRRPGAVNLVKRSRPQVAGN